ncbi:SDR family oxidoreductase [Streptomyces sp. SHP 1-2]|uniref:SDR family oxidoreductase n=1 Tax=Streptomyces sp. SHP 1-2 TaxID=2769489 RepID=UPI00223812F5|nr:SDR family oxidoreductase [Streptomyces sp. SHP 1-2]MCW5251224.1 SDR family oxidoreductase [Streptomyces sp. SHP 1-2]
MRQLKGKLALVTGGARNVGRAVARELALRGAHVLVNYFHSHAEAQTLRDELRALGAEVDLVRGSVARQDQVDRMFAEIDERFGYLDILVNNAANGALVPLDEITDAHLDRAIDTNYKGGLRCARAAAPLMARRGGGSIIQLSALGSSQMVMANYLACAPAKAAAEAAARYLAVEFAPLGIRVNTASAAMLVSEVADQFPQAAEMQRTITGSTPFGRLGRPEEFAAVVAFLASDDASWITGQVVLADGGLSLGAALMSPRTGADPVPGDAAGAGGSSAEETATRGAASAETPVPATASVPEAGPGATPAPVVPTAPAAEPAAGGTPGAAPGPAPDPAPGPQAVPHALAVPGPEGVPGTEPVSEAEADTDEIAVVGMGLAVAGANGPEEFWELRTKGAELFVPVPEDRWERRTFHSSDTAAEDKSYQDTCVFITDFEPVRGSVDTMGDAADHELTTTWLRHSLVQALDGVHRDDDSRYAFLVGYTPDGSQHLEEAGVLAGIGDRAREVADGLGLGDQDRERLLGTVRDTLARRYWRGAQDPARFLPHHVGQLAMDGILPRSTELQMVDTACSSSLYAVDIGVKGLQTGKHDIAVCGGAFALAPRGTVLFSKLQGLSKRGAVHSLDAKADGVIFADGAGVVVLKRLRDARRDGDRVLGVLKEFGASSDGKGKAIYAPNSAGQDLAVRAALDGDVGASDVDWIIAHATGTPAGDLAEFTTLRSHFGRDRTGYVTSNKSLIGHTGWAAGVVSVIEALLAMEHETIPRQFRYSSPQPDFDLGTTRLEIPKEPVPWPAGSGRPRTAAVSGFGFGGTNAHLIVQEDRPDLPAPRRPSSAAASRRVAVVAWSAHVPGLDRDGVTEWVTRGSGRPGDSFGETYPPPPFQKVRMPPATVRTIDRCQLMILECAHDLRGRLTGFWDANTTSAGVFVGNMGPTRAAMLFANRCFLDDVEKALTTDAATAALPGLDALLTGVRERVRGQIPASNEDSFPGMMPNIISARVANHFDLKGPNITLDAGPASALAAIETACRYLRTGELEFALAGGINGNSLPEYDALLDGVCGRGPGRPPLAEGSFLFTLATEETARAAGLDILGYVDELTVGGEAPGDAGRIDVMPSADGPGRSHYLGAAGGLAVLEALHRPAGRITVTCAPDPGLPATHLTLTVTGALAPEPAAEEAEEARTVSVRPAAATAAAPTGKFAAPSAAEPATPAMPSSAGAPGTGSGGGAREATGTPAGPAPAGPGGSPEHTVVRHVPRLTELADTTGSVDRVPFLPAGVVVLTDLPDLGASLRHLPADATVLSTAPVDVTRPGWRHLPEVTEEAVGAALAEHQGPVRHLRVVTDLARTAPLPASLEGGAASLIALHDAAFLTLRHAHDDLGTAGSSFVTLLTGALDNGVPHPFTGLFTGLVKCAHLELADCLVFALGTGERGLRGAALAAERESTATRPFPVVLLDGGRRLGHTLAEAAPEPAPGPALLGPDAVVLAVGGARGITAEVVKGLAARHRPRVYLIGSNPLDSYPAEVFEGDDEAFAATRQSYIRKRLAGGGGNVARISREFDRMTDARAARANIRAMEEHCGPGRVTYLSCDVQDADAVGAAVGRVLAEQPGGVDLLINAAGRQRSALIKDKSFAEFTSIRDLKLRSYRNLRRAFAARPPRSWCNFGSLLGYFGQLGEPDYASGNDFLASAATWCSRARGAEEFTVGWTLWDGVGMGADELTKAYFKRAGSYSHMPVAEGVDHFVRELATGRNEPSVVHLGAAERATVERFYPGYLDAPRPSGGDWFYLRRKVSSGPDEAVHECVFDLAADGYLRHHRVRGVPTLPGTFVTEIAAEAARELVPGLKVVAFEDLVFHHFLRVYEDTASTPKRIAAKVVARTAELTAVEIRITTDVRSPGGVLLVEDRPHFTARVLLAAEYSAAPRWEPWDPAGERPVADPYHVPASPVSLTGPFVSTHDTRLHPLGKRSTYRLDLAPDDPAFSRFTAPSILLDGLARTGVLHLVDGRLVPIAAPLSIRRIDLYTAGNDLQLTAQYGRLDLYATPPAFDMTERAPDNRFVAVAPGGRVVLQMKDVSATVIGYVDAVTGALHTPDKRPVPDQEPRTAPVGANGR